MTTGVPLYLVSACGSAEEFVAAFRRYADRTGLFVPSAMPLPAGRRGRIAVTLADGGVMIEGEAEILQSSSKPTVLYGRPGMTIKFVDPDEASKQVIGELEKARLAMRPAPTASRPRPASVPAEPRPVPPPIGGRIDAANALAECVVIGDPTLLRETAIGARALGVPSIPAVGTQRPNTPSKPPPLRTKTASVPPVPRLAMPSRPADPLLVTHRGTSAPPNPTPPSPMTAQMPGEPTAVGLVPQPPAPKVDVKTAVATEEATRIGQGPPPRRPAKAAEPGQKATSIGFPVQRAPFETQPLGLVPPAPVIPTSETQRATPVPRGKGQDRRQRVATPVAPMPAMRAPAKSAPLILQEDERTDISDTPAPAPPQEEEAPEERPTEPLTAARSGGMRASEILAAIPPSGDWTMAPDESAPHLLPGKDEAPEEAPAKAPSGNWTISLDREKGAWGEPEKVDSPPPSGNPVGAVAGETPVESREEDKPTSIGEPKIEIDPTLMEPLQEMPVEEEPAPPPLAPMPPLMPAPTGEYGYADMQSGTYPPVMQPPFESGQYPPTYMAPPTSSRTLILMVAGGVLLVGAIIALVILAMAKRGDAPARVSTPPPPSQGSAEVAMPPVTHAPPPPPVAIDAPEAPKEPGKCNVEIASTPPGAEIMLGDTKLGVTPGSFELPCGSEAKLSIKKATFTTADRSITPAPDQPNKLVLKLTKLIVSLKVTSTPAGATITSGGKSLGVTPTTIKLPMGDAATLTLTKPGFATHVEKTTARPGATIRVTLKKKK